MKPLAKCRQKGYVSVYTDRPLSGRGYIVPAAEVAKALLKVIDRIDAEQAADQFGSNYTGKPGGARTIIAERAAEFLPNTTSTSVYRRMNGMLRAEYRTLDARNAEAMLLAVDLTPDDIDLPTLPGGLNPAKEMLEIWHDLNEVELDEVTLERDARRMVEITRAYIHGADRIDQGICESLEALFDTEQEQDEAAVA